MTRASLVVPIGSGLVFRFDPLPRPLHQRIEAFLAYFIHGAVAASGLPVEVSVGARAAAPLPRGRTVVEEPPLTVRQAGDQIFFELPRVLAWCDVTEGRGGLCLESPSDGELDLFIGLALVPMLIELGASRGWFGIHAAGVAVDGFGILLPGPSGVGKSTIFGNVHRAGHEVLSDDVVWLAPGEDGPRMVAFPRGAATRSVPWPTTTNIELQAIVCPEIVDHEDSVVSPLMLPDLVDVLVGQSGFLSSGAAAGDRFRALVRLGRSIPGYRLEAGRKRDDVPALLASLAPAAQA